MSFEQHQAELRRLKTMGAAAPDKPSDRELLLAKQLHPSTWSTFADDQIAWAHRHKLGAATNYFGAQYLAVRELSLIQAIGILRLLDRLSAGKASCDIFDARGLSKLLDARWQKLSLAMRPNHRPRNGASNAVFSMLCVDGIPAPQWAMDDNAHVTLTWKDDGRKAAIHVTDTGAMTLTIGRRKPEPITFDWRNSGPPRIGEIIDWIFFGGPEPAPQVIDQAA